MPSFIIVGYVWQILGRRAFLPPHPWAAPKMSILNKANAFLFASLSVLLKRWWSLHIATFNKPFIAFNLFWRTRWASDTVAEGHYYKSMMKRLAYLVMFVLLSGAFNLFVEKFSFFVRYFLGVFQIVFFHSF